MESEAIDTDLLPYHGVIFDMDGTLIANTEAEYLAWKWLFTEYNYPFTFQEYLPLLGIRSADVMRARLGLEGNALQHALDRKMAYYKEIVSRDDVRLVPGARSFLDQVRRYPVRVALATSARREKMEWVLEKAGLQHYFDVIVTGEDVRNGKPAPDIYLKTADRLSLAAGKCLVVEDAVHGITAARRARMTCVAIVSTHPAHLLQHAHVVLESFEEADFNVLCQQLNSRQRG